MPNLKNAKKAVKVIKKKKTSNNDYLASMKTAVKNVERAVESKDKNKALENLNIAIKRIDKANSKGAIKQNHASRNKSRLTKKVNAME